MKKHGRMHCQSDCRGINKKVLMKMLNFEGSARMSFWSLKMQTILGV
jgi:hypothetical protein